jgi:putative ABC transport system permease protein
MKDHHSKLRPPRLAQRFLRWYCRPDLLEDIEGDIHEDFRKRLQKNKVWSARFYYTLDVIRFFKPFAIKKFSKTLNNNAMFKINTRIAFRNLAKNKLYSFINITGLAIGIAACLIITHYVLYQLSFDKFHKDADRIYRVTTTSYQNAEYTDTGLYCGYALAPALLKDVPEIERAARVHPYYSGAVINAVKDSVDASPFFEEDIFFVDPSFLEIFSFEFVLGDKSRALLDLNSVIITEEMADKYFGENHDSVIGKTLKITGGFTSENFKITGVLKDVPANSHIKFNFLLPMEKVLKTDQYTREGAAWGWTNFFIYAELTQQATEALVETKIADLMHTYNGDDLETSSVKQVLSLEPILDVHLRSTIDNEDGDRARGESINSVYFLVLIATFIMIIAWINFINLSTAKASERGSEIGIKKAMGALKPQLIVQFLTESFWINLLAVALAVVLTYSLLPILGSIIEEPLQVDLRHPVVLIGLGLLIIIGPLLSGIYPAFILSSFGTTQSLKGGRSSDSKGQFSLRKVLVVFQFVISTLLIAGTFVVSKQLNFMQTMDTGYDMDKILIVKGPRIGVNQQNFDVFKNSVSKIATVEKFASSRSIPGAGYNFGTNARREGVDAGAEKRIDATWIDKGFMETYGMELVAGQDFSDAINGPGNGVLLSETAVKTFGLGTPQEAIEKKIIISGDTARIRGIVKDHNWKSLHQGYVASAFYYVPATAAYFSLRINTQNTKATLEQIEEKFITTFPGNPLDFYFLDDFFNKQYKQDQQFAKVFNAFAGFAIFAACLGLFGLASYTVVQKTKEIGIRKVLGARSIEITLLFSKRYMFLILIANLLAIPIAYFGMKSWLENYAFSIPISVELFLWPILLLAIIAIITISFQTVKASLANPVKNLRSE